MTTTVKCAVCDEPWDSLGVGHNDMLKWEAKLFWLGAGCPCCQGGPHKGSMERLAEVNNGKPIDVPPWTPPPADTHWQCSGCEVASAYDHEKEEDVWLGGKDVHYRNGIAFAYPLSLSTESRPNSHITASAESPTVMAAPQSVATATARSSPEANCKGIPTMLGRPSSPRDSTGWALRSASTATRIT